MFVLVVPGLGLGVQGCIHLLGLLSALVDLIFEVLHSLGVAVDLGNFVVESANLDLAVQGLALQLQHLEVTFELGDLLAVALQHSVKIFNFVFKFFRQLFLLS